MVNYKKMENLKIILRVVILFAAFIFCFLPLFSRNFIPFTIILCGTQFFIDYLDRENSKIWWIWGVTTFIWILNLLTLGL